MKTSKESQLRITKKDAALELLARRKARHNLLDFVQYTMPDYRPNWHHVLLCEYLDKFLKKEIKHLMVFMPPQHGKSQLVSKHFPAYTLGKHPKKKIVVASYAHALASKFNRDTQRIVDSQEYHNLFPDTRLNESNVRSDAKGSWLRNSDEFEVVGHGGRYLSLGVGGPLTGSSVDIIIIDDPVKDAVEAKSLTYQLRNLDWWNTVVKTRLRNESQVIMCQTRWDEGDLSGRILEQRREGKGMDWTILELPAIKEKENDQDPRPTTLKNAKNETLWETGNALWPEEHSLESLLEKKDSDIMTFRALYQQDPSVGDELKVFPTWKKIEQMPEMQPFYGLDFGYSNDPTCLVQIMKHNRKIYVKELIYQKGLSNSTLASMIKSFGITTERIYADSAEPKTIDDLCQYGLNVIPALKGPDSVRGGINKIKEFMVHITVDSLNGWHEQKNYQWRLGQDGKPTNEPRDAFNHFMDAVRYGVYTDSMEFVQEEFWI
jgi:hypothetical protein